MRKSLKSIVILLFAIIFLLLGYQIISKISYKKEVTEKINAIPLFCYKNINGKDFTNDNLKKSTPVIFIYFNTECGFCNEEAEMISQNINKFKDFQIVFISLEEIELIKKFAVFHKLNNYDNLYFLRDSKATFATTFDVNALPCIVLYNKNQKLIEKIKGQTKPEFLLKKLKFE
ncbi:MULTISPECIES: peroxiredoxin family protein [Flavobacterium]|uniref:peroxiredoxin family protein n=1 Tax=Flavobacterium TaxID=237 RepID=UPI001183932B|nr:MULTISPECIES: redoxin domain-containing protein [Flavobacterium]MCR4032992.1 peroxiredoxin family protein [Flavobacterium panacis]